MRPIILPLALLASSLTLPIAAHADSIDQFTFNFNTPPEYLSLHLTVDLPASPPLSFYTGLICGGQCFVAFGESGSNTYVFQFFQSSPVSAGTAVDFAGWIDPFNSPLPVQRAYRFIFASEDLFTGSLSDPTFLTGTFDAVYRPFFNAPTFPGTITIEPKDTTVPEPSTLAMMATGILGAITIFRSRKPRVS
jgi:hypothetical protein